MFYLLWSWCAMIHFVDALIQGLFQDPLKCLIIQITVTSSLQMFLLEEVCII